MSTEYIYDSCPEILLEPERHPIDGYQTGRWVWSVIDAKAQADWTVGVASSRREAASRAKSAMVRIAIEEYGMDPKDWVM